MQFVGMGVHKLTPSSLNSFDEKKIGILQVFRNIAMKETISEIEKKQI